MDLSRRAFTTGVVGFALGGQLASPAFAQSSASLAAAFAAIRAYGEAHRAYFGLPGLTLGLVTPNGDRTVFNFGFANIEARITDHARHVVPDRLDQQSHGRRR